MFTGNGDKGMTTCVYCGKAIPPSDYNITEHGICDNCKTQMERGEVLTPTTDVECNFYADSLKEKK